MRRMNSDGSSNRAWAILFARLILGFIFWWPLGLIILGIGIGSRKMGCWSGRGYDRWHDRMQDKMDRMRAKMESFGGGGWASSGNRAFDEYRGGQLPAGSKSVAFTLTFRSPDRTLTDAEVDRAMTETRKALAREHGAELRS